MKKDPMENLSSQLENNKVFLQALTKLNRKQKKHLINHADRSQILAITEILFNILKGHVELNELIYSILLKHKKIIRQIIEKQPWKNRKALLQKSLGVIIKITEFMIPLIFASEENEI